MARRLPLSSWPPPAQDTPVCALCGRAAPHLTEHHLIPRSQGRHRGAKVSDLPTAALCGPCHKFLHRTFSNAELAQEYSAVETLLQHEDVRRFVAWVRKQPASRSVRVR